MWDKYDVGYFLPVTTVRFTGKTTVTTDELRDPTVVTVDTAADACFITRADSRYPRTAQVRTRPVSDVNISLSLTDDQRLTAASSDSTGQLGSVVSTVLGTAVTTGAMILAAGLTESVRTYSARAAADNAEAKYLADHAEAATLRTRYRTIVATTATRIADLTEVLANSGTANPAVATELSQLRIARLNAEAELTRLDASFDAWRAGFRKSVTSELVIDVPTDALPAHSTVKPDSTETDLRSHRLGGTFDSAGLSTAALAVWNQLGVIVTRGSAGIDAVPGDEPATDRRQTVNAATSDGIVIRRPDQITWRLWSRVTPTQSDVVLVRESAAAVVDARSSEVFFKFRKSMWAKRSIKVGLSDAGILKQFDATASSSAAAVAAAVNSSGAAMAGGVKGVADLSTSYYSIRDARSDHAAAQLKRQLDQKQTELTLSGLNATAGQYDELLRLQQQVALTSAQASLDPAALQAAAIQRNVGVLSARKDEATTSRELRTEIELSAIRQQVDAVTAAWQLANPGE